MYSAGVVQVLPRRQRALMMSHQKWWAIRSWQCPPERSKLILLKLHEKLSKDSTLTILLSFCIWSKLERWRSWISGCLISWLQIKKKNRYFEVSSSFILYNSKPFLNQIVTCDKKRILYDNQRLPARWLDWGAASKHVPKPNLHQKKVLVTVWWSAAALIHCSFLNPGETTTSEKYAQKIEEIHQKLQCLQLG